MPNKKFLIIIMTAAVVVFGLPALVGWLLTPAGHQFYGSSLLNPGDPSVYYSYIEQGRQGRFVMYDAFTSERQTFPVLQPWWFVLGRIAHYTGQSSIAIFHIARLALIPLLVLVLWWATKWIFSDAAGRRLALWLTVFGGGMGGAFALIYTSKGIQSYPDLWVAEIYPALNQLSSPHFLLVTIGLVLTIVGLERSWQERRWDLTWLACLGALVVTVLHPFHIVTWLVYMFGRSLTIAVMSPRRLMGYLGRWLMVAVCALPAIAWYGLQLSGDPLAQARAEQNNNITWPLWQTATVLGLTLPLAIVTWRRRRLPREVLGPLVVLAVAYLVAIYLPFNWQRRLSHGLFLPFAWLAAPTLLVWWQRWSSAWSIKKILMATSLATFLVVSPAWTIGAIIRDYPREISAGQRYVYYLSPEQQQMAAALRRERQPNRPLLASFTTGRIMAGLTAQQVFIAHTVETNRFTEKLDDLKNFYGAWTTSQQQAFMRTEHLCYIVDGPRERAYGSKFQAAEWPDLKLVWSNGVSHLFRLPTCS